MKYERWLRNLPYYLLEVFVCKLFGHKPIIELSIVDSVTVCNRCNAVIKKRKGEWVSDLTMLDCLSVKEKETLMFYQATNYNLE